MTTLWPVGGVATLVALVLLTSRRVALRPLFRWLPVPLWCYFLPSLAVAAGWLPHPDPSYRLLTERLLPLALGGLLIGTDVPATGFAFGFDRLVEAMAELDLLPKTPTATSVLVTIFSQELLPKSLSIVTELRNNNVNADIVLDAETKLDKQLKYANNKGIPYVVIVGSEEVKKNVVKLKDMKTGEQKELTIEDCIALCK